ncbi:beta-aspartyl-peptidase [Chromohalobacter israelensis]|uniref:Isoaspartyl dipeptidase n=1 Tax=Chromohalobacter israelensis (strain ATCC BAA-138 / DSM 3043 / CIP 106854 / NCIMB 13768 / 1H11) TaxID=290398 RepID=Q1QYI7_CHRI1|nr:beta-aspartyl-peptidase [Chromohalobacter salexigens]ABE58471.1 Peptidase M38, beta-aspartyl dipeptidase [Chromohalobacter salexigens DSM 3043]MDO0944543.1 beta-aspartyl-peptidase [Chromohalobacter salexigens]
MMSGKARQAAPMTLLRVAEVFAPERLAATDILMAGGRIVALGQGLAVPQGWPVQVVDARHLIAVPAFIDQHVHVTGGGGEGGCGTRCPPITTRDIVAMGIGTVVGVLGTDSISRSPADLLAAVRGLAADGLAAYMYTGAYRVPAPTLTGDIQRDLAWIPEVIGVGEIAISDHRSSQPRQDELERLVSDARVGAMLAGKRGICHFHLGDGKRGLEPLRRLLTETEIPADQVIPTHVNRRAELLEEAAEYALAFDASVDVTAFEDAGDGLSAFDAVSRLLARGVSPARITLSSDCNGSLPEFDADGAYVGMQVARNTTLIADWRRLVHARVLPLESALGLLAGNVARVLGLADKGRLAVGSDADITLLDKALQPQRTFVAGRCLYGAVDHHETAR